MPTLAKDNPKPFSRLFIVMIVVGLVMTIFGYFGSFVKVAGGNFDTGMSLKKLAEADAAQIKAGESSLGGLGALRFFANATFVLTIVVIVWFVVLCIVTIEDPELIHLILGGLVMLAALFTFIFSLVVAKNITDLSAARATAEQTAPKYALGYGAIFHLIGGLLFGGGVTGLAFPLFKDERTLAEQLAAQKKY